MGQFPGDQHRPLTLAMDTAPVWGTPRFTKPPLSANGRHLHLFGEVICLDLDTSILLWGNEQSSFVQYNDTMFYSLGPCGCLVAIILLLSTLNLNILILNLDNSALEKAQFHDLHEFLPTKPRN